MKVAIVKRRRVIEEVIVGELVYQDNDYVTVKVYGEERDTSYDIPTEDIVSLKIVSPRGV